MNQVLHIFRKDLRHFWKEIAISWCVLVIYVWQVKEQWNPENMFGPRYFSQLTQQFVLPLLILSWWVLLIRAIQDERLVGDRQFWVTRPYRWVELLSSKVLFVLVVIHVPLLIAQFILLKLAGFAALPYLGGLLSMHAALLALLVLPVAVIATVTSTFVRVILFGFIVVLYGIGSSWLSTLVPESALSHASEIPSAIQGIIFLLACAAVILIQYARRWTLVSRGVIVVAVVLTLLIEVATPYSALIARAYPARLETPVKIVLNPTKPEKPVMPVPPPPPKPPKKVNIAIPLLASPVNSNEVIVIQGARIDIELPDGNHWRTKWQPQWGTAGIPDSPASVSLAMPTELFDRIKSAPVKINTEFALAVFLRGEQWQLIAQDGLFPAPRFGLCTIAGQERNMILCRAPLYGSGPLVATTSSSESTCPVSAEHKPTRVITSYYWSLSDNSEPSAFISPVVEGMISFNAVGLTKEEQKDSWRFVSRLCAGTPIHFTALSFVRHTRMTTSLDGIQLSDYKMPDYYGMGADAIFYGYTIPRTR
ncbi:MAG TPA: hypothetical protein VNX88_22315 [Terriglobales bacterium]|jgi:hypothetical protein|nr:hypothetical protein [Terriglobales bacterium]